MPEEKLIGRRHVLIDHVTDHAAEGNASEVTPGTPSKSTPWTPRYPAQTHGTGSLCPRRRVVGQHDLGPTDRSLYGR